MLSAALPREQQSNRFTSRMFRQRQGILSQCSLPFQRIALLSFILFIKALGHSAVASVKKTAPVNGVRRAVTVLASQLFFFKPERNDYHHTETTLSNYALLTQETRQNYQLNEYIVQILSILFLPNDINNVSGNTIVSGNTLGPNNTVRSNDNRINSFFVKNN